MMAIIRVLPNSSHWLEKVRSESEKEVDSSAVAIKTNSNKVSFAQRSFGFVSDPLSDLRALEMSKAVRHRGHGPIARA